MDSATSQSKGHQVGERSDWGLGHHPGQGVHHLWVELHFHPLQTHLQVRDVLAEENTENLRQLVLNQVALPVDLAVEPVLCFHTREVPLVSRLLKKEVEKSVGRGKGKPPGLG